MNTRTRDGRAWHPSSHRWIDWLPVNFPAGFIDNRDVKILVACLQLSPNHLCQPFAVGDGRSSICKLQSNLIARRNTVPDVEVISSHCTLPRQLRFECGGDAKRFRYQRHPKTVCFALIY